ncbi:MAG: hypothetical protein MJY83_01570 [Bacteroidales bacterium]|nr:hypothetical protein [Bacteroidales bacterium]
MKYVVRALKYWLYISVLMALVITMLSAAGVIPKGVGQIFNEGWISVAKIEGMFLLVSAIYPRLGYTKASAEVPGEFADIKKAVVDFMDEKDYVLEREDGENLYFRNRFIVNKITRVWEDRLSFERSLGGWTVEGKAKDAVRIASALSYKFSGRA